MPQGGLIAEARQCIGCGALFIARRHNQLRHDPECGRNRTPMMRQAARSKRVGVAVPPKNPDAAKRVQGYVKKAGPVKGAAKQGRKK